MCCKRSAVIFVDAAYQAHVEAAHKHPLSREFDPRRRMKILNKDEIGARFMPAVPVVLGSRGAGGVISFLISHRFSPHPDRSKTAILARYIDRRLEPAVDVSEPAFTQSAK